MTFPIKVREVFCQILDIFIKDICNRNEQDRHISRIAIGGMGRLQNNIAPVDADCGKSKTRYYAQA